MVFNEIRYPSVQNSGTTILHGPNRIGFFRDLLVFFNWLIMNRMGRIVRKTLQTLGFSIFDRRGARAGAQSTLPCSFNSLSNLLFHRKDGAFASV